MINVSVDEVSIKEIEERLGAMRSKAPVLLKKSVNEVAQQSLRDMKRDVKEKYRTRQEFVSKEIYLKGKPNVNSPQISLLGKGIQHELMDFEVTPKTLNIRRKKAIRGGELKSKPLERLEVGGRKAFIARFKSGHITAVQRQEKTPSESKLGKRYIKKLMGSSMMIMMHEVWKEKQTDYSKRLRQSVEKHIKEVMGG